AAFLPSLISGEAGGGAARRSATSAGSRPVTVSYWPVSSGGSGFGADGAKIELGPVAHPANSSTPARTTEFGRDSRLRTASAAELRWMAVMIQACRNSADW